MVYARRCGSRGVGRADRRAARRLGRGRAIRAHAADRGDSSQTPTTPSSRRSPRASRRRARPGATTRPIRCAGASRASRTDSCCGRARDSSRASALDFARSQPVFFIANHLSYIDANVIDALLVDAGYAEVANGLTVLAGPKVFALPIRRMASLCFGAIKMPQSQSTASGEAVMPRREVARLALATLADRRGTPAQGRPPDGLRRGHAQPQRRRCSACCPRPRATSRRPAPRSFRSACGAPRS